MLSRGYSGTSSMYDRWYPGFSHHKGSARAQGRPAANGSAAGQMYGRLACMERCAKEGATVTLLLEIW